MKITLVLISVFLFCSVILLIYLRRLRRNTKKQEELFKEAFDSTFGNLDMKPKYVQAYSYSFPSFKVIFSSKEVLEENINNKNTDLFATKIGELCTGFGSKSNPFDVSKAIWFTFEGELESMLSSMTTLESD